MDLLQDSPIKSSDSSGKFVIKHENDGEQGFSTSVIDTHSTTRTIRMPSFDIDDYDLSVIDPKCKEISRVLVLYTGGTIGMKSVNGVYEPIPNYFTRALRKLPMFNDGSINLNTCQLKASKSGEKPFIMPLSKDNKRVIFAVHEYSPLLDSCQLTMDDYIAFARDIESKYSSYDGFIILHGTDTMAYTGSALSFILENLGKPVIITGSQIPIFETRSDGRDNFLGALIMAGHYCIPEVMIFFHNKLYRANRVSKVSTNTFDAFDSPNYPPIAELGVDVEVYYERIFRPSEVIKFRVNRHLCNDVAVLRLFPSITCKTVCAFLRPPIKGIVLQTYGAGNFPAVREDILEAFQEATKAGILIVNISQCFKGSVKAIYATGACLEKVGVVPGEDMTIEAALAKLSYVLGNPAISETDRNSKMSQSLRGELTQSERQSGIPDIKLISHICKSLHMNSTAEAESFRDHLLPAMMCAAAKEGDIKKLESLQAIVGHLQVHDYDNRTPLHLAVSEGQEETVKFLLNNGAFVHPTDRFGSNPLMNAIRFHRANIIPVLINSGAHIGMGSKQLAIELNHVAASNDVATLRMFYLAGVTFNESDGEGRTPLHVAARLGHEDCVRYMLSRGANPQLKNIYMQTPLNEAEKGGRENVIAALKDFVHDFH